MYDLFNNLIDHVWDSNYGTTEETLIYSACIVFTIVVSVVLLDWVYNIFKSILSHR